MKSFTSLQEYNKWRLEYLEKERIYKTHRYKCLFCNKEISINQINDENCPHCGEIVTYTPDGVGICMDDCVIGTQFIDIDEPERSKIPQYVMKSKINEPSNCSDN